MRERIWGVLADHEGCWVAVDGQGRVVSRGPTLPDVMRETGDAARKLTFLYAAAPVRS